MDAQSSPDTGPVAWTRRRTVLLVTSFFVADGLLRAGYFHFGARAHGHTEPIRGTLISELTGSLSAALLFFLIVLPLARRWPFRGRGWPRSLLPHVGGLVAFSAGKTLLMWGSRSVLYPLAGLGRYDYGTLGYRFTMEFSQDVIVYSLFVAGVHAWDAWRAARDRELREARLETSLGAARFQALQAQLQPHFLFNTLNAISSVMYADPEGADRLMSRLSDLLRTSLSAPHRPEVALEEELRTLEDYVQIMRARLGDRLVVRVEVEPAARNARVPVFLLQPLVENAIQHGIAERAGAGEVVISVRRERASLIARVLDDGPGPSGGGPAGGGVGLTNTRERLRHLYGDAATVELRGREGGGAVAEVRLPFTIAEPEPQERPLDGDVAEVARV